MGGLIFCKIESYAGREKRPRRHMRLSCCVQFVRWSLKSIVTTALSYQVLPLMCE